MARLRSVALPLLPLLLCLLLSLPLRARAAVDTATCVGGDCCWSGNAERYCACTAAMQTRPVENNPCALVRCAAGPPPDACAAAKPVGAQAPAGVALKRGFALLNEASTVLGGAAARGQRCACPKIFRPVCADGRPYANACTVRRARERARRSALALSAGFRMHKEASALTRGAVRAAGWLRRRNKLHGGALRRRGAAGRGARARLSAPRHRHVQGLAAPCFADAARCSASLCVTHVR
jgi:hypothetical protein